MGKNSTNKKGEVAAVIGHKRGKDKFKTLFESVNDAIFILDAKGNFIDTNETAYKRLGYTKKELMSMHISELDPPEFAKKVSERFKQIKKHGEAIFESAHIKKDGTVMHVETNARAIDYDGQKAFLSVIKDITERKKAEEELKKHREHLEELMKERMANLEREITERKEAVEALRESEKKYRDLYDNAPDMYHSLDKKGIITDCNKTEAKMLGYKKKELIGRPLTDFLTDESKKLFKKDFKWFRGKEKGKRKTNLEREFVRKDGTTFPALLNVFAEFDKDGKFIGTKTISRNVAERKEAERELKSSKEFIENVLDSMHEAVSIIDVNDFKIVDVNRVFVDDLGLKNEEVVGKPCYEVTHHRSSACSAPEHRCPLSETVKTKGHASAEHVHYKKNGDEIIVEVTTSPLIKDGNITQIVHVARDISERKEAEEKIKESEEKYRTLFENMTDGFAYCKMLFDKNNKPIDFVYLEVNGAFERLTTLKREDVVGKRVTEAILGIKETNPELFDICGHVALTGEETEFEIYFEPLEIWLSISVYSPERGYFVAVFDNITERKEAEEEMKRRLMKFSLKERNLYLVKEPVPAMSIEAFNDLLKVGYQGLVISRTPEEEFEKAINGDSEFLRLAEKGGEKSLTPELGEIEHRIESLPGKRAILLDRLDYLVFKNSFKQTLSFVQNLREMVYLGGHVIILSIDPSVFKGQELRLLEKEAKEVEPIHKGRMPENLLEILRFIYKQNTVGIKPSYGDIKKEMGISKPTVKKRIRHLVAAGYLTDIEKGRTKIVETTEKGTSLFLR